MILSTKVFNGVRYYMIHTKTGSYASTTAWNFARSVWMALKDWIRK